MCDATIDRRADEIFRERRRGLREHTSRLFALLLVLQWLGGVAAALLITPRTWVGLASYAHLHVWIACFLGGLIALPIAALALARPDDAATPFVVAVGQMLASVLFIHLSGGRIESHFHIFGSLAFLAFYRDWRVLVPATVVVVTDHLIRGIVWPASVYGVLAASPWRSVEHGAWVLFEDAFLVVSCVRGMREMRFTARQQAETELAKSEVEQRVEDRTAALRASEERFRSLSAWSPIGIFEADRTGDCVYVNARWAEISGYSLKEALGDGYTQLIHPDERGAIMADWMAAVAAGRDYAGETRALTARGEVRWISVHARPRTDAAGEINGYVGAVEDVTANKHFEAELRHARDVAETSARLKSEFVANMSHELRTPMNGIFGMIDLALDTTDDGERAEFLQSARRCAANLMTLINGVLDFSRIESGSLHLESIPFAPHEVLDRVLETLATEVGRKQLELVAQVDPALPPRLVGDPTRLGQILLNLAGNAVKFTERGEVVIRLEQIETPAPVGADPATHRATLRVSVRDTGIGIPADKHALIFESFTQADGSMTRQYGGTGLGLTISKSLVEAMGGQIGVSSEPGAGSTFWFTLPLTAAVSSDGGVSSFPSVRVVVLAPHEATRAGLLERLSSLGLRAEAAADATEVDALVDVVGDPVRLLLLDETVPGAFELAAALVERPDAGPAPIMLASIAGTAGRAAPDAPRIARPVRDALLIEALRSALRGAKAAAPRSVPHPVEIAVQQPDGATTRPDDAPRILVAEDDPISRRMLTALLGRWGFTVETVVDGPAALRRLEEDDAPPLALLDWMMPGLDGPSVCRRLRAAPTERPCYLILVTAKGQTEEVVEGLRAGADDYLTKPFDPAILHARLAVGMRVLDLQHKLLDEVARVEALRQLEVEHRHAQKLEAVGRLASGIAHEINTPIQFVGDNTRFVAESVTALRDILARYHELATACDGTSAVDALIAEIREREKTCDVDYIVDEVPKALAQTLEGVDRVAEIVRAMKTFAHPDVREKAPADLNGALRNTLVVARNELKYVADVETDLGALPEVVCNVGDINQVFLNLLVNAAHAIADVVDDRGGKGLIRVATRAEESAVLIGISDTGSGISAEAREHIFEPFFTTKAAGRGTGQGLALARACIVEQHGGELWFESETGRGTTFFIRLPLASHAMGVAA